LNIKDFLIENEIFSPLSNFCNNKVKLSVELSDESDFNEYQSVLDLENNL